MKKIFFAIIVMAVVLLPIYTQEPIPVNHKILLGEWHSNYQFDKDGTYIFEGGLGSDQIRARGKYSMLGKTVKTHKASQFWENTSDTEDLHFSKISIKTVKEWVKSAPSYQLLLNDTTWLLYDITKQKQSSSFWEEIDFDYKLSTTLGGKEYHIYKGHSPLIYVDAVKVSRYKANSYITITEDKAFRYKLPWAASNLQKDTYSKGEELEIYYQTVQKYPVDQGIDYWYLADEGFLDEYAWLHKSRSQSETFQKYPVSVTISKNKVNYRDAPNLQGKKIGQLNRKDKITILKNSVNGEKIAPFGFNFWYQFQTKKGKAAWVFGAFIETD